MFIWGGWAGKRSIVDSERFWFAGKDLIREELVCGSTQSVEVLSGIGWWDGNSAFFLILELFGEILPSSYGCQDRSTRKCIPTLRRH